MTFTRRHFLWASASMTVAAASAPVFADNAFGLDRDWDGHTPMLLPDPAWELHDPGFDGCLSNAMVERLWSGGRWTEGPVWMPAWRCLLFSDIPNNRIMRWSEDDGRTTVFNPASHHTNGNTRDLQGRLLSCEHDARRVVRTEHNGSMTVILDRFEGKPLNAPNDIAVAPDGSIWVTDPGYGILGAYEGHKATPQLAPHVYRIAPEGGAVTVATDTLLRPNGLAFSSDAKQLYISDTDATRRHLKVFDVDAHGLLNKGKVLVDAGNNGGVIDGLSVDSDGNLWCSWAGDAKQNGVKVFSKEGKPLATLHLPETVSNLEFGGPKGNRLFITCAASLYATFVNASAPWYAPLTPIVVAQSAAGKLVEAGQFGRHQPVGLTFSDQNRLFATFPRQGGAKTLKYGLVEIVDGEEKPYPDLAWNTYDINQPDSHFLNAHAVVAQGDDLWVLDSSAPVNGLPPAKNVKLLRISLAENQVKRIYRFEDLPVSTTSLNDFRIDAKRNLAYFSDPKSASIVILDLSDGTSRRVLTGHRSTLAEPGYRLHMDGRDVVSREGKPFVSNVNGIALTHDGKWFYYRAINQDRLYRIETRYLTDLALSDNDLDKHVQDVGKVGVSHGMLADAKGNIYLSDSINHAINKVSPEGVMTRLVQDERLSWPDTFAIDTKGDLYVTASQLNRTEQFNPQDRTDYPYRLYKVETIE